LTITVALLSLLTNRPARRDVAMTGEITLTGRILPVSGLKEKILAARRAKVKTLVVPARNRMEIGALPPEVLAGLEISFAETIREVIDVALVAGPPAGTEAR
jgi:ATP-dependent Lon protease